MTRKNIFTVKQTSQILNLSQSTVYRYLKQGKIKSVKSKGQYQIFVEDINKFFQIQCLKNFYFCGRSLNSLPL